MRNLLLALALVATVLVACGRSEPATPARFDPFDSWSIRSRVTVPPGLDVDDIGSEVADAMESVEKFTRQYDLGPIDERLQRVEVVATEAAFLGRLRALGVARDGVAVAKLTPDGLLLAVTPAEHERLDRRASKDDKAYAWLLAKAIWRAHHLHLVGGRPERLGPEWLREGTASMAAEDVFVIPDAPFRPLSAMTHEEALAVLSKSGPEHDVEQAAATRAFLDRITLKQLIDGGARPDLTEWLAGGARPADTPTDCPTVAELHPLVGKKTSDPAVAALRTRLGKSSHQHAHDPRVWHHYAKHGISLVVTEGTTLSEINLRNSAKDDATWYRYCGALPGDIDFSWDRDRVHEALGRPDDYFDNKWLTIGYHATFADWGKSIEIFSLRQPFPVETARIRNLEARPDVMVGGLRSLEITFQFDYRKGEGLPNQFFRLGLQDRHGEPIQGRRKDSRHVHEGKVRVSKQVIGAPADRMRMLVPYYVLDLPAGDHHVTIDLRLQLDVSLGNAGRPARVEVEDLGTTITMPKVRWLSTGVRSLRLAPGNYDRAVMQGDTQSGKPDPHWYVCYATLPFEDEIFDSTVRTDSHSGTWHSVTPFFPLLDGDAIQIRVYDEEVTTNDLLVAFPFDYAKLKAAGTVTGGQVESMVVAPLRERPGS